ncbi:MAG: class I SAM-dependent methyltransferase [Vicingaceae bacterium]
MRKENWTEDEIKVLAKHLRKPQGDIGLEVAERMNQGNAAMNLHTLAVLNPQAHMKILEIGMGNGFFVKNILELNSNITYHAFDYSKDMVDMANELNQSYVEQGRAIFMHGGFENSVLSDSSFDQIFTVNTLYFWEDVYASLKEINRLLKADGRLIISIRPKHIMQILPVTKYDFNLYEKEEVLEQLRQSDFVDVEVTHVIEPPQEGMGTPVERECLIFNAKKRSDSKL